jgi:hypothetical protein
MLPLGPLREEDEECDGLEWEPEEKLGEEKDLEGEEKL